MSKPMEPPRTCLCCNSMLSVARLRDAPNFEYCDPVCYTASTLLSPACLAVVAGEGGAVVLESVAGTGACEDGGGAVNPITAVFSAVLLSLCGCALWALLF